MLYKDLNSSEVYIHLCDDIYKYTKQAIKERMPIYSHDMTSYTLINNKLVSITHCPYCGKRIETDERNGKLYDEKKAMFYDVKSDKYYNI